MRNHGPYYFVRTWDSQLGAEFLQVSIDGVADPAETREALHQAARRHGCVARIDETPLDAVPSPLWNAGFDGSGFSALSKRLYQEVSPTLVSFLDLAAQAQGSLGPALGAIRLMAAHSRATLLRSPQRGLAGYGFRDLLSLRLLSYRSHFEGIYPRTKDPESFEAACARFYAQVGEAARDIVALCGDPDAEPAGDAPTRRWTEFIISGSSSISGHFVNGTVVDSGRTLDDLVRERGAPVEPTRFHTPPIPELDHMMYRDVDFLTFRLQTSMLYSCLHTLGFSLAERYVFCYVVARANEEKSEKSVQELRDDLEGLARSLASASTTAVE